MNFLTEMFYDPRARERAAPAASAAPVTPSADAPLENWLRAYEPISLAQLDAAALMDRMDTKYVLDLRQLEIALRGMRAHYAALEIDGRRANSYQTLYFDTPAFDLYLSHHAGRPKRCKVRSRRYVESNRSFFEVKFKNYQRTRKERIETRGLVTALDSAVGEFLDGRTRLDPRALEPKLWNNFTRITLVNHARTERVTLDTHLSFANAHEIAALPGIVVAEVKHTHALRHSQFAQQMQALYVQPMPFSKYCIGVSMLYPHVKHNRFKPTLRALDKLARHTHYA